MNAKNINNQSARSEGTCIFCGLPSTTRDHVPPKGLFPAPRPSDLITVPSCDECNNGASDDDEKFRNYVVVQSGRAPHARSVWKQKALRSIKRNRREFVRIVRSMREVDLYTQGGIYLRTAMEVKFEAEPHDQTIRRITKGLYWHHFGTALPFDTPIEVIVIAAHNQSWAGGLTETLRDMRVGSVGGPNVFGYAYGRAIEDSSASLWLYKFYNSHVVMAATGPAAFHGSDATSSSRNTEATLPLHQQ